MASEQSATAAAEELAEYEDRFAKFDGDLHILKTELGIVKAELGLVKWIVSGIGFGVLLLVMRAFL